MRIYLDACCINRPFDDLTIERNRLEAAALETVLRRIVDGMWQLLGSEILDAELQAKVVPGRSQKILDVRAMRIETVAVSVAEASRARDLVQLGFRAMDAMHVACAESAGCDVLLTTDDQFQRCARRHSSQLRTRIENPVIWLAEVFQNEQDHSDTQ